ncbi:Ubiquitin thioesterase otubain-like [Astathelohania contejeani]|uniref:ubiquitinyl hydrolase 1 n=1 Tax=Astathelohania contejeani TaxID=164912 RepID=A0ABQ7HX69_9MICR|nr:Ubiquitin thioesterase otubain-like [Thelohania contejeani]
MSEKLTYIGEIQKLENHKLRSQTNFNDTFTEILKHYSHFRECTRDGNCFYSSALFKFLELVPSLQHKTFDEILEKLQFYNKKIVESGIEEYSFKDFYDAMLANIHASRRKNFDLNDIDDFSFSSMIAYSKLLIATEMRINPEKYKPFILDYSVEEYCKKNVDPFYVEAGHLEIDALVNVLNIGIEVISVENSQYLLQFGRKDISISLLYTPNHFEPIYKIIDEK